MSLKIFERVEDLEQGSNEWLRWRATVIGSSDASAILGENPWKSRETVLKEKIGEKKGFKGNARTQRGTELEPVARSIYCNIKGVEFFPTIVQNVSNPWQAASLDGLDSTNSFVVEIKCGEKSYIYTSQTGKVPQYYYAQLQHILAVTGIDSIDYFSYQPNQSPILITIPRDENYINSLLKSEIKFMQELATRGYFLQGQNINFSLEKNHEILKKSLPEQIADLVSGERINGTLSGLGYIRYESGGFYVGQWLDNHPCGKGIQKWGEESDQVNHWYLGDVKSSVRHGEGVYLWPSGQQYIGSWVNGHQEGKGTLVDPDGSVYIGYFKNGQKNGYGRLSLPSGITYIGEWSSDEKHGKGKTIFHDGSLFEGEYKNNLIDGYGIFIDSSERYAGNYRNGLKEGYGKYVLSNGTKYEGSFKSDKFEGSGECIWPDGSSFKGAWIKGRPDGLGLYTTRHGSFHEGIWKDGFSAGLFKRWLTQEMGDGDIFIDTKEQWVIEECSLSVFSQKKINENKRHCLYCREYIEILTSRILDHILKLHLENRNDRIYCCNQSGFDVELKYHSKSLFLDQIKAISILEGFCDFFETDSSDTGYYINTRSRLIKRFQYGKINKSIYIWAYDDRNIFCAKRICNDDNHESTHEMISKLVSRHNLKAQKYLEPADFSRWDSDFTDFEINEMTKKRNY